MISPEAVFHQQFHCILIQRFTSLRHTIAITQRTWVTMTSTEPVYYVKRNLG